MLPRDPIRDMLDQPLSPEAEERREERLLERQRYLEKERRSRERLERWAWLWFAIFLACAAIAGTLAWWFLASPSPGGV